jgi:hypothetical protein
MDAKVYLTTHLLGGPKPLNASQASELYKVHEQQGWGRSKSQTVDVSGAFLAVSPTSGHRCCLALLQAFSVLRWTHSNFPLEDSREIPLVGVPTE